VNRRKYRDLMASLRLSVDYWLGLNQIEFTNDLQRIMAESGMNQSEIAERYGAKQPFISKVLAGSANLTLRTMVKLAMAAGAVLHVQLAREDEVVRVHKISDLAAASDIQFVAQIQIAPQADSFYPELEIVSTSMALANTWGAQHAH
jgi:transcriptional regulator with XRE-family HTH domain